MKVLPFLFVPGLAVSGIQENRFQSRCPANGEALPMRASPWQGPPTRSSVQTADCHYPGQQLPGVHVTHLLPWESSDRTLGAPEQRPRADPVQEMLFSLLLLCAQCPGLPREQPINPRRSSLCWASSCRQIREPQETYVVGHVPQEICMQKVCWCHMQGGEGGRGGRGRREEQCPPAEFSAAPRGAGEAFQRCPG